MNTEMKNDYKYFAFISYKREDSRWGKWLQKNLQKYRLPSRVCKNHVGIPKRLNPIFLDTTDLPPGELRQNLKEKISECKYFISICSKNSKENPKYIDLELQCFLETHDRSMVIPFIVDKSEAPEKECFSPLLCELCEKYEIIGANVHEQGKRRAFLKTVAYMHGISVSEIETWDSRRVRRNKFFAASAAALCLISLAFAIDYFVPKTKYYLDYTTVYGVPRGIGVLSKSEIKDINYHYTIVSSQNKVRELRYENFDCSLVSHSHTEYTDRPTKAVYKYKEDGILQTVTYYDAYENEVVTITYTDESLKCADFSALDGNSYAHNISMSTSISDMNVSNVFDVIAPTAEKTPIVRYIYEYDENGYTREIHYATDTQNTPLNTEGEIGGVRYERDELGRATKLQYLFFKSYENGDATASANYFTDTTADGVSGRKYEYNSDFDLSVVTYFDKYGNPILNSQHWAINKLTYENHNISVQEYFGKDGERVLREYGYSIDKWEHNLKDNSKYISFFDSDGKPVINSDGYASILIHFDEHGNRISAAYFDLNGKPTIGIPDDAASYTQKYDENGQLTELKFFDIDGKPKISNSMKCAKYTAEFDGQGNIISMYFYSDTDELLFNSDVGYAGYKAEYDEYGNYVYALYLGEDGKPMINEAYGFASRRCKYDNMGNMTYILYFDENEKPMIHEKFGYAGMEASYDKNGNMTYLAYLGEDGKLMFNTEKGFAGTKSGHNEFGDLTYLAYLGTDGNFMVNEKFGYAICNLTIDEKGNVTEIAYFGADEKPMLNEKEGFAILKREYDKNGNTVYDAYYGADGKPMLYAENNYSSSRMEFDENNNATSIEFFDVNGKPMLNEKFGYAKAEAEYDADGNRTKLIQYDADGNIIKQSN